METTNTNNAAFNARIVVQTDRQTGKLFCKLIRHASSKNIALAVMALANSGGGAIDAGIENESRNLGARARAWLRKTRIRLSLSRQCHRKPPTQWVGSLLVVSSVQNVILSRSGVMHWIAGGVLLHTWWGKSSTDWYTSSTAKDAVPFIEAIDAPESVSPGDELTYEALRIGPHHHWLRVQFLWLDESIKVLGPYMSEPNIFEFPPTKESKTWRLKFGIRGEAQCETRKELFIVVDELRKNARLVALAWLTAFLVVGLSSIPAILNYIVPSSDLKSAIPGFLALPLPVIILFSVFAASPFVSDLIHKLSSVRLKTKRIPHETITARAGGKVTLVRSRPLSGPGGGGTH
jgi:hypothetical protein